MSSSHTPELTYSRCSHEFAGQPRSGTSTSIVRSGFIGRLAGFAMPAAASNDSWQDYVAACDVMCCVVGTDGNICAANEALQPGRAAGRLDHELAQRKITV